MIISVNWLKQFTTISSDVNELVTTIGARLVEVESVTHIGEKYKDALIVKVVESRRHEDSDHLNVTRIDDGGVWHDVERDGDGLVQVVCGADNVRTGLVTVWLPPNSVVPESFGEAEPFVLGTRELRGVMSNGMLASPRELDLYDDHEGIIEVDLDAAPGTRFAEVYLLDDYLLDIENKSLTHRPDTFGIVGFAREVAAVTSQSFVAPEWLDGLASKRSEELHSRSDELSVSIQSADLSSRYSAAVVSGFEGEHQTPLLIKTFLSRSGIRPISPIVDVTNYLMLLTGQPLHAFDYDKVVALTGGHEIQVRSAHEGETLELLNGKTIELSNEDIVVAGGDRALALAGAMGGIETAVDASTKKIIIESATFNLYKLRATQMRHGIFTDAITRVTKGQPASIATPVLIEAVRMLHEITGMQQVDQIVSTGLGDIVQPELHVSAERLNSVLGSNYTLDDIATTLKLVDFQVAIENQETLIVASPVTRTDIHIVEDVIEEVGRINGYETLPLTLPSRSIQAVLPAHFDVFRDNLRTRLAAAGANEVLSYSFVHGDTLRAAGQDEALAFSIENAISPALQFYRLSLTPSLLEAASINTRNYDEFAVFELNKVHSKRDQDDIERDLPKENDRLGFVYARASKKSQQPAFYLSKYYLDYLLEKLHLRAEYRQLEESSETGPFEPKRSASVYVNDVLIGTVGEYRASVVRYFKLPSAVAGFEIDTRALFGLDQSLSEYVPLSKYPSTSADICFKVASSVAYEQVTTAAEVALGELDAQWHVGPLDLYQGDDDGTKNITIRVRVTPNSQTLTGKEMNDIVDKLSATVSSATGAVVI